MVFALSAIVRFKKWFDHPRSGCPAGGRLLLFARMMPGYAVSLLPGYRERGQTTPCRSNDLEFPTEIVLLQLLLGQC